MVQRYKRLTLMSKACHCIFLFSAILSLAVLLSADAHAQRSARAQSAFEDPGRSVGGSSGGGLVAVSSQVDGGEVTVGSSAQVVILLRNDGIKPVTLGAINMFPSSGVAAKISLNQCVAQPLQSGEICAIAFSIKGLQAGNYRLGLLINHDGKSKLLEALITGSVVSSGDAVSDLINDIDPVPSSIAFSNVSTSRPQVRSIILRNVTSSAIEIEEMFIEASPQSGFTLNTDCKKLQAGQACLASVTWTPKQEGDDSGVLVLRHNGPTGISSVPIDGSFSPDSASEAPVFPDAVPGKGLLVSSQTDISFGSGIDIKSAITISLVNVGDEPLTINQIRMSNEENGITIAESGCGQGTVLAPVEACAMTVFWEPVREGDIRDDIQIYHTGARGILVLPLTGSASKPVNKDSRSIVVDAEGGLIRSIPAVSGSELGLDMDDERAIFKSQRPSDFTNLLDGFSITSLAATRGIINGPGGSRVVHDGEETVIGGVLWDVDVRSTSITFTNGDQRVLLLFDKSLSSVNQSTSQSGEATVSEGEDN